MVEKWGVTFLRRKIFASHRQKTSWVNLSVFQKCSGRKKFLDKKRITILSTFFVSHRRKTSWANPSVFQKCSAINFFWIIWVSRYGRFLCLTVPKDFLGKPYVFYKIYGMEKIIDKRRRTSFFLPKILVSQSRKISYGNPSVFQRISGVGKLYAIGGRGFYDSTSDDFLSQMGEKQRGQTPVCF